MYFLIENKMSKLYNTYRSKDIKEIVQMFMKVAYRLCDYIAKGEKEMLVSNRLRSIADIVLERVADILGNDMFHRVHSDALF